MQQKKSQFYIVFPGLGKTTWCKSHPGMDLDGGPFKRLGDKWVMYYAQIGAKLFKVSSNDVFTNVPDIIPYLKSDGIEPIMLLPQGDATIISKRILERGDMKFASDMLKYGDNWINGWRNTALKYHIKVHAVTGVSDFMIGVMKYEEESH